MAATPASTQLSTTLAVRGSYDLTVPSGSNFDAECRTIATELEAYLRTQGQQMPSFMQRITPPLSRQGFQFWLLPHVLYLVQEAYENSDNKIENATLSEHSAMQDVLGAAVLRKYVDTNCPRPVQGAAAPIPVLLTVRRTLTQDAAAGDS
jgi:hypothetical protein